VKAETFCACCGRPYELDMPQGFGLEGFDIRADRPGFVITIDDRKIKLSSREAELFKRLLRAIGQAVHRETLYFSVWGDNSEVDWKIIDVLVFRMRRKLAGTGIKIETIWGFGFRMIVEPQPIKRTAEHHAVLTGL
jgi:DNA-binding response OmpR family regulator